jgi:hypothetical protein
VSSELFELKVMVEADDWREVAALMDTVDRALDPHRQVRDGTRRWSVMARRVPGAQSTELLRFIDRYGGPAGDDDAVSDDRLTA